ncbi:MAG: hypothetical protein QHI48_02190 [Bacteroidota bacterium]|nr:hypothetical protein [Bacteroidota bacterium]
MKKRSIIVLALGISFLGCGNREKEQDTGATKHDTASHYSIPSRNRHAIPYDYSFNENFPDGIYEAEVQYNNPKTRYSATYTLDVEVADNVVVKIYFPNGGWLDEDHIIPNDLDEEGWTEIEGEEGKTYQVRISR